MRRIWMIATVCFCLPAIAQMKVCMGGNLDSLTASEKRSCENQVQMARTAAEKTKAPADWHFVVVCGEDGWKDYMAFSLRGESELTDAVADTDVANKTTFLRGSRMLSMDDSNKVVAQAFTHSDGSIQVAMR